MSRYHYGPPKFITWLAPDMDNPVQATLNTAHPYAKSGAAAEYEGKLYEKAFYFRPTPNSGKTGVGEGHWREAE
jgi:hypothetical protein